MGVSRIHTMSAFAIWVLLSLLSGGEALQCYRCLNMNTSGEIGSQDVYNEIRTQVKQVLNRYYYIDNEHDLNQCPHPNAQEEPGRSEWADLENVIRPCQALTIQEAACALGRFRVTAEDYTGKQYTLHGTILGCARRELLQEAIVEVKYKARENTVANRGNGLRPQEKDKTSLIRQCGLGRYPTDNREKGLTQEMEIEHCAKATNLCSRDFCIPPEESEIRVFLDQQEQIYVPWFWIILAAVILGVCIAALSMLGLKFS